MEVCATLIATITARQATAELAAEREGEDLRAGRLLQAQTDGEPTHPYVIHHSTKGCFAIRQGKWKLVACQGSGGYSKGDDGQPAQLYDLEADPYEKVNRIETDAQQARYLADLLERAVANGRSTPGTRLGNDVPVDIWKTKIGRPDVLKTSNTD